MSFSHIQNIREFFFSRDLGKYKVANKGKKKTLIVENLTSDDEGTYVCQTEDQRATIRGQLVVVKGEVKILKPPRNVSAVEGEVAMFEAEISDERVRRFFSILIFFSAKVIIQIDIPGLLFTFFTFS